MDKLSMEETITDALMGNDEALGLYRQQIRDSWKSMENLEATISTQGESIRSWYEENKRLKESIFKLIERMQWNR